MFTYDKGWDNLNSSLVKGVFYNSAKRQMLVRLNGNKQYIYTNVEPSIAATLAETHLSKGRVYNQFRKTRRGYLAGAPAHGETVVPAENRVSVSAGGSTSVVNVTGATKVSVTGNRNESTTVKSTRTAGNFKVRYVVDGKEYSLSVDAASLSAAAADVEERLGALGLSAEVRSVAKNVV